jgi:two-component system chemotaxis response regulator CheY
VLTKLPELVVYLVEPSSVQGRIITTLLGQLGVTQVHRYSSAAEVLSRLREALPSVVVSALYLPDMSGTELVQTMRNDRDLRHVPFILKKAVGQSDCIKLIPIVAAVVWL